MQTHHQRHCRNQEKGYSRLSFTFIVYVLYIIPQHIQIDKSLIYIKYPNGLNIAQHKQGETN